MSEVPLLQQFISLYGLDTGRRLTVDEFLETVRQFASVNSNVSVSGSSSTLLYSGNINGTRSFSIAQGLGIADEANDNLPQVYSDVLSGVA